MISPGRVFSVTLHRVPFFRIPSGMNFARLISFFVKPACFLNTSCTIEIGALKSGEYAVDGIAYIGIPNDYQFTGIVQALSGEVNPTGALADTYATDSTSSPAMMNFGGGVLFRL